MGETGQKIYGFFKRLFGRRAELERKVALLEINYDLLKQQYKDLDESYKTLSENYFKLSEDVKNLKTVSARTMIEEEPPSSKQILNEWLNGEENDNE